MNVTKIPKKTITVIEPKRSLIVNKEQYRQRRVAAYCRVSTDSEDCCKTRMGIRRPVCR